MKAFAWDEEKNELLKRERHVSFEEVVYHINNGNLLVKLDHPNRVKYAHQQVLIIDIDGYVYMVPFVEDKDRYFLKTIIPSRKLTRDYLGERKDAHETE
ncbi:MAG: BrnT family toxin [Candidatus Omnitrophica bacterium]|nr:BrnT family toxin [Candidatus Omnitrophota bacterium]